MQIKKNTHINNRPNFKAIKSLQFAGLYKKEPELSKELIDTFKEFLDKTHSPKEVIRKYRKGRMNVDTDQKESEVMIDGPKK